LIGIVLGIAVRIAVTLSEVFTPSPTTTVVGGVSFATRIGELEVITPIVGGASSATRIGVITDSEVGVVSLDGVPIVT
jgi:ABC-type protease/lipase transport system fused ATPase/permease subunit